MHPIKTILVASIAFVTINLTAQPRQLTKVLELKMPKDDIDFNNGVKGASV